MSLLDNLKRSQRIQLLEYLATIDPKQVTPENALELLSTWMAVYQLTTRSAGVILDCDGSAISRYRTGSRIASRSTIRCWIVDMIEYIEDDLTSEAQANN